MYELCKTQCRGEREGYSRLNAQYMYRPAAMSKQPESATTMTIPNGGINNLGGVMFSLDQLIGDAATPLVHFLFHALHVARRSSHM